MGSWPRPAPCGHGLRGRSAQPLTPEAPRLRQAPALCSVPPGPRGTGVQGPSHQEEWPQEAWAGRALPPRSLPSGRGPAFRGSGLPLQTPCSRSVGLGGRGCADPHSDGSAPDKAGSSQPAGGGRAPTPSSPSGTRPSPHAAGEGRTPWQGHLALLVWMDSDGEGLLSPGVPEVCTVGGSHPVPAGGRQAGARVALGQVTRTPASSLEPRSLRAPVLLSRAISRDPQKAAGRTWLWDPAHGTDTVGCWSKTVAVKEDQGPVTCSHLVRPPQTDSLLFCPSVCKQPRLPWTLHSAPRDCRGWGSPLQALRTLPAPSGADAGTRPPVGLRAPDRAQAAGDGLAWVRSCPLSPRLLSREREAGRPQRPSALPTGVGPR